MTWLRNSFGKMFLITFERDTYSFVLVKGYLKTFHIVFLTILITIICSSSFWQLLVFDKESITPFFVQIFLYSLLIITFLFLWNFYSNTDFFRRFFPLMLWGLAYLLYVFNSFLGSIIPSEQLTFLFSDKYLSSQDLEKNIPADRQFAVFFRSWFQLLFIFLFFVINRNYWKEILRRFRASPASFLFYLLGLILVYNWFFIQITKETPPEPDNTDSSKNQLALEEIYKNGSALFKFSFYFSSILIIPFWEEIIYRYLPTEIFGCKKWTIPLFIFATLWFAFAHIHTGDLKPSDGDDLSFWTYFKNLFQKNLIVYWYMSFIFIAIYWIADFSLVYPVTLHFFVNLISLSFLV